MRVNRAMTSNPQGLRSTEALCNFIGIDKPNQDILKANLILIHKMIKAKKPQSILNQLRFPSRSCGFIKIRDFPLTEHSKRSALNSGLNLYNAIHQDYKVLPNKSLKKKLKKMDIDYDPPK